MAWFDRLFGSPGSFRYRYDEGDEYPGYSDGDPWSRHSGWYGPHIFQDPRRGAAGSSYDSYYPGERPFQGYDVPAYVDLDDRPSSYNTSSNAWPAYSHHSVPRPYGALSTEETDRAIALALEQEEHFRRRRYPLDDEDEELAAAMRESLDLYHSPRFKSDMMPTFRPSHGGKPPTMGTCAGCKQPLGYGRYLTCINKNWHPNCFSCKTCNKPITDREFSVQGGEPYHRDCYRELFHPRCEVCSQFIPANAAGLIEYRSHPFWNQKYCPRHERDGTPRCCSCDRIESGRSQYSTLEDGRKLCHECLETAVVDTRKCQPLYREILKFYKNVGMMIDQEVPMLLVARSALNEAREGEKEGMHTSETRGLCLSEEQTITSVFGGNPRSPYPMRFEPQKLVRRCEVTAILVLYGLPRLLTGSILAHELMHAWLRLAGEFPPMRPNTEEGICQVMSHIWLTNELKRMKKIGAFSSPAQEKLGEFYLHQIATDTSPVYGDGFRRGLAAVNQFGLRRVLEHLRMNGNLP